MARNLTLTIDEHLLLEARKIALDRNTSVNAMVRDFLADVTSETRRRAEASAKLEKLFAESRGHLGPITWTRDELYERSPKTNGPE